MTVVEPAVLPTLARGSVVEARENEWFSLRSTIAGELTAEEERSHREEVRSLGERLKRNLGLRQSPLAFDVLGGEPRLRVSGVAGTLNLSRGVTVQVSPKFAEVGEGAVAWEESVLTILERVRRRQYVHARTRGLSYRPATFFDHMALAYVDALTYALREEPIRTYFTQEEITPFLRGQFAVERQVASMLDRPGRIHCNVDYLETNNPYNHLLHWAARRFEALAFDPRVRRLVADVKPSLPAISGSPQLAAHLPLLPPPQYRHFADALEIASTLARGFVHSQVRGTVRGYGYLLNMEQLFERFVEVSVAHAATRLGPTHTAVAQETRRYARSVGGTRSYYTRPDNVVYEDNSPRLLVDAKYKRLEEADKGTPSRPNNTDVYQLFASMVAHGVDRGLLVYPRVSGEAASPEMLPLQRWEAGPPSDLRLIAAARLDIGRLRTAAHVRSLDEALANTMQTFMGA